MVQDWYLRIGTCVCSAFQVPWADLRYLFGEIMYGGHIVNDFDRWGGEGAGRGVEKQQQLADRRT